MIINAHNNAVHAVKAVYVNGRYVGNVISADDVLGEVTYANCTRAGYVTLVGDEVPTLTAVGHVQIELFEGWSYDTYLKRFIVVRPS